MKVWNFNYIIWFEINIRKITGANGFQLQKITALSCNNNKNMIIRNILRIMSHSYYEPHNLTK